MKKKTKVAAGIGVGVAAAAAAVAGAYYFYGKHGAKHRRELNQKIASAKQEIERQVKKLKIVNRKTYDSIVTKVSRGYEVAKKVDPEELAMLARQLRGHWDEIRGKFTTKTKKRARTRS